MKVICDIETDGLAYTQIFCISCIDIDTLKVYRFSPDNLNEFPKFAEQVTLWVGHNFLDFDAKAIKLLLGVECTPIIDTMILSRLDDPKRPGGHGLDNLLRILGKRKTEFNDFTQYSEQMMEYCVDDTKGNYYVYVWLKERLKHFSDFSIDLEHKMQAILNQQRDNGFAVDVAKLNQLNQQLTARREELEQEIERIYPPVTVETTFIPKVNNSKLGYQKGVPVIKTHTDYFNLKSPSQVVAKMNEAGWKPTVRTKTWGQTEKKYRQKKITKEKYEERKALAWKLCEENFDTLPPDAPEGVRNIGEYLMIRSRLDKINEIDRSLKDDGRVHGTCISLGASTHRAAHYDPQMGNQPGAQSPYGKEMRELFIAPDGKVLQGCDAKGIQGRLFAHYVGDEDYVRAILTRDMHDIHMEALGPACPDRDHSKTFYYATLFGAAIYKQAAILGCSVEEAREALENLYTVIPGFGRLQTEVIPQWVRQGYMVGLDGRRMAITSAHTALSVALQGGEKIVMALANVLWNNWAKDLDYMQVAFVHDEWESECADRHTAEKLGEMQVKAIKKAGEMLNLKCPLDGKSKIGRNWYEVH